LGLDNKTLNSATDTTNKRIEKELYDFKGLVKKIKPNKIQIKFRNKYAEEDTAIIILERLTKIKSAYRDVPNGTSKYR